MPDITGSSTAWLMVQAIIDTYGNGQKDKQLCRKSFKMQVRIWKVPVQVNQKVHAGEVAIAFGLRHQAVADKMKIAH
ncbi:MAG: hypothetical protein ACLSCV_03735 [Acutalibacteraceae bacterium]